MLKRHELQPRNRNWSSPKKGKIGNKT